MRGVFRFFWLVIFFILVVVGFVVGIYLNRMKGKDSDSSSEELVKQPVVEELLCNTFVDGGRAVDCGFVFNYKDEGVNEERKGLIGMVVKVVNLEIIDGKYFLIFKRFDKDSNKVIDGKGFLGIIGSEINEVMVNLKSNREIFGDVKEYKIVSLDSFKVFFQEKVLNKDVYVVGKKLDNELLEGVNIFIYDP